jgi:tripartite tricarboxylate transporter TctB family protein
MVSKKPGELALAAFFVFLGIVLYVSTAEFPERAQTSTAVYVRFVGLGMAILSAVDFVMTLKKKSGKVELFNNKKYFFGLVGMMLAYMMLLMLNVGFMIATIPFLAATSLLLGYRNWKIMAISFVGILLSTYLVFFKMLQVPMP